MVVTINFYDEFMLHAGTEALASIGLDANVFKAELYNSTHTFTAANNDRADISANALATNFGYTNPGKNLASVTWAQATGTTTWDAANVTWTASGGTIGPADDCVIYDDDSTSPAADLLVCSIDFGGSENAGDGTDFLITFNASGIFTIA